MAQKPTKPARKKNTSSAAKIRQKVALMDKRIHIVPEGGKWAIRKEGATKASRKADTKAEALEIARAFVKSGSASTIISHKKDGTFSRVK